MKILRKLFGGLELTWPKLIIWAVIMGVLVGGLMLIPVSDQSSVKDIGTNFEWWILFGIIIVANSKSPVDSAAKAFVFFLISQPLIYLVQVPFASLGWELFGYYKYWFYWTLATIPMGAVGHFVKRGDVISSVILAPMTVFLTEHMLGYGRSAVLDFPHHLASAVFCAVFIVISILGIARTKNAKIVFWLIEAAAVIVLVVIVIVRGGGSVVRSYTFHSGNYNLGLDSTSEVVASTNIQESDIREFNGNYYLDLTVTDDENASVTVSTNGTEKTYLIRYSDEEGVTLTLQE